MNYYGSYRKLLENSKAAVMAAIEIYNKPTFCYRDECSVILLLNAWELALKALLSKSRKSIYYPKKRNQPYRTLTWRDALNTSRQLFPPEISYLPTSHNLELLGIYRDNAVHFYNDDGFGVLYYALAQTAISNFKDFLSLLFDVHLEDEINWQLMPIGIKPPVDVVSYISGNKSSTSTNAAKEFLSELASSTKIIKDAGDDTGRLLTVFSVKLESVKKIGDADIVVGIDGSANYDGPLTIFKPRDPNVSHPLRQSDIVCKDGRSGLIDKLHGITINSYVFQAMVWKYDLKSKDQYCWEAEEGCLIKYSRDVVPFLKSLSKEQINSAVADYKKHMKERRRKS